MTQREFEIIASAKVKEIVNCISWGEYDKLSTVALISNYWCFDGKNQAEGISEFAEWLQGQLELWSEEDEKEYVIDLFDEAYLQFDKLENNYSFATYTAASHGEALDFWFEFELSLDENGQLTAVFNVNI